MPGLIGEGEGCNGIECCKNIALTGNEGAAERRIEIVFRRHPPGEKFLGLPIGGLTKEALRQGGFDFAGVGDGVVLVESNDAAEIINAGDVVIRNYWLDDVLPFAAAVAPNAFDGRRPQLCAEFAVGAEKPLIDRHTIEELFAIIGDPKSGGAGDAKPGSPTQG